MIFNSLIFMVFFAVVFGLRWLLPAGWAAKKGVLLVASILFYGAWRAEYLLLILISTLIDWSVSKRMYAASDPATRKRWLLVSLCSNLGMLTFFKYTNFFVDNINLIGALSGHGEVIEPFNILLPVGISFYTFQTLSYTIDIYRDRMKPWGSFWDFALFVTFFPQLVAGPIVRAVDFKAQCEQEVEVSADVRWWGAALCLVGMFQKIVLADMFLAPTADRVFGAVIGPSMRDVWLGVLAFSGQIYFDFAGYSICAIGLAMMLGFVLPDNFNAPYAAKGFSDFWRRWHISLSSWLKDYLYISLGGNRGGATERNLMLTMLLGGLWHGASWNFVLWGFLHGTYLVVERRLRPVLGGIPALQGRVGGALGWALTLFLVCLAWIPFRAKDLGATWRILAGAVGANQVPSVTVNRDLLVIPVVVGMLVVQRACRDTRLEVWVQRAPWWVVALVALVMFVSILVNTGVSRAFVYFQF